MTMGKVGGERNFGYGKQVAWEGKNALADRYGDGHYDVQVSREAGRRERPEPRRLMVTAVNITEGTKGGRGHIVDRWVPVLPVATEVLERAVELQSQARNLIPEENSYTQWRDHPYHAWSQVARDNDLKCFHDLRAAYACARYEQLGLRTVGRVGKTHR